ncbi:hypothetical protein N7519_005271 [Penicillium mononematosum]|uniref:uncharacterized protein n=1 Tax=Penicillium mononematosum TaxID=268346 RepID=UPI002548B9C0|nr:uncharacterized protein N7519_005271 [Penicillium mononematosum]KAJ6183970.1 hypothetical protein N7519_005271 [Penicillium mononematosum]
MARANFRIPRNGLRLIEDGYEYMLRRILGQVARYMGELNVQHAVCRLMRRQFSSDKLRPKQVGLSSTSLTYGGRYDPTPSTQDVHLSFIPRLRTSVYAYHKQTRRRH